MKKKILAVLAGLILALSMTAFAAPEETEPEQSSALLLEEAEEIPTEAEPEAAGQIEGFYILNYAQAQEQVNLNIISESDLTAVSEQADTVIYHFCEDHTAVIYDHGMVQEGTYQYEDGSLIINVDGQDAEYQYEFIDGLLIIRSGEESSILYDFALEDLNYISISDYSTIEVDAEAVAVTEDSVDDYIASLLQGQTTSEEVKEGTTQTGDLVTIAFEGVLEGEEVPFEGGSSDGLTLQLGSGALVEDFEEQITGVEIGSTVDVRITFPEDYSGNPALIGKKAVFSTTILSKTVLTTPELTDEWVRKFTGEYLLSGLDTVEELRDYCRQLLEKNALHAAMFDVLADRVQITGYNGEIARMLLNYAAVNLSNTAGYYGLDINTYISRMGYDSVDTYLQTEASSYITSSMIVNKLMVDLGLRYTREEFESSLAEYVRSGFGDQMTVEQYSQQVGTVGIWAYTNMVYKYDLAMEALEDRVVRK